MRLWTLHPKYLDRQGLLALWREGLLAQAVLNEQTTGYRHHPQLQRFRENPEPLCSIAAYLTAVVTEAEVRGYSFNSSKILQNEFVQPIPTTTGQVEFERGHLLTKLRARDPEKAKVIEQLHELSVHPLFVAVEGPVESWERGVA